MSAGRIQGPSNYHTPSGESNPASPGGASENPFDAALFEASPPGNSPAPAAGTENSQEEFPWIGDEEVSDDAPVTDVFSDSGSENDLYAESADSEALPTASAPEETQEAPPADTTEETTEEPTDSSGESTGLDSIITESAEASTEMPTDPAAAPEAMAETVEKAETTKRVQEIQEKFVQQVLGKMEYVDGMALSKMTEGPRARVDYFSFDGETGFAEFDPKEGVYRGSAFGSAFGGGSHSESESGFISAVQKKGTKESKPQEPKPRESGPQDSKPEPQTR